MDQRGDFAADKRLFILSAIAVVIGLLCAGIAKILLLLITLFTNIFYFRSFSFAFHSPSQNTLGVAAIAIPVLGGLIIGLMARYGSDRIRGHGIPEALEAILFGKSKMSLKVALLKPLSSAISIGSGGPFGAEGPIIMTGGALGSLVSQVFHLSASERKVLLVSGAAAGMSAIFAAPVSAVLLAVELLLFEWRPRSLIPVALASSVAGVLRVSIFEAGPLFPAVSPYSVNFTTIFLTGVVGIVAGLLSFGLSGLVYGFEDLFSKLKMHWMWWPALGGLAVGIGGYFEPRALGVGYDVIGDLLKGGGTVQAILLLVAIKCAIWACSLGSGTSGGVLAPLLIIGGGLGAIVGHYFPAPSPSFWPMVSMAAVMGGMMRSPFTGAVFALELTGDFNSLLPLLVAVTMAYGFTVLVMKRSILTEKVARRGFHVFREYSVDFLERVHADEVMTTTVETISENMTVSQASENYFGNNQKHLGYPVLDARGKVTGIVTKADLVGRKSDAKIKDVLPAFFISATPKESCKGLTDKMAQYNLTRIPIVDPGGGNRLIGLVTLFDLLKPRLKEMEEEKLRERVI